MAEERNRFFEILSGKEAPEELAKFETLAKESLELSGKMGEIVKNTSPAPANNFVGFKDQILFSEFEKLENKVGLFGFINGETCSACTQYLKQLKNLGDLRRELTLVLMMKHHMQKVLESDGVSVPFTRVYNGGQEPIWEVSGVLYSTQIESLYKAYKTLSDGTSFHTMDEFEVYKAKAKPLDVQAFDVKSYVNLRLLGKTVIARPGQVVVLWKDSGRLNVLDGPDFDAMFDRV